MLRVTEKILPESGKHRFDALNEVGDRPTPDEKLYVYIMSKHHGSAFVDGSKFHGRVSICSYKLAPNQPADSVMRYQKAWEEWCIMNDPRPIKNL
jgi:hypothetical protein